MKICITNLVKTSLDVIKLQLEGLSYNLTDVAPLCNNIAITAGATPGTNVNVYIDIPMTIQGVTNGTNALPYRVLTDSTANWIKNIQQTSVAQFKKGRSYLILSAAGSVTNIMPQVFATPIADGSANDAVYTAGRYLYCSYSDMNPIGALTVDVITYDIDLAVMNQVNQEKSRSHEIELASFIANN